MTRTGRWVTPAASGEALAGRLAALAEALRRAQAGEGGVEIATTPKDEIARRGKARLYRYRPLPVADDARPARSLGPMLILHGLIGRQTIADLEPGRSLVRRLLEGGVDLFVLDWGNPTRADCARDFTDYAEDDLGAFLAAVRSASGAARVALLGICEGGVFALCHAARHSAGLLGVVPVVTPVDFHADREDPDPRRGLLNVWVRSLPAGLIERLIAETGNLPGQLTGAIFQQLAPARTLAKYSVGLAALAGRPARLATFLRMEKWLADRPDHPGAAAREWLIGLYQENRLVEGRFEIAGEPIDLGAIACPVLNVFGTDDHIIPPPCARALARHVRPGLYEELRVPAGHVGVFVSRRAQGVVAPAILDWLARLGRR